MGNISSCTKSAKDDIVKEKFDPVTDKSASNLSDVGKAAYEVLRTKHARYHKSQWNVTKSKMIGSIHETPGLSFFEFGREVKNNHSDWFADKMAEIMGRTTKWCDVMNLPAPDGYFLEAFQRGLKKISDNSKNSSEPIVVRLMFGNIIGLPINCERLVKKITKGIPDDANIRVWVGAWRNGVTWNHAKLIAVDGKYLHTGGHNVWSDIYLKEDPVHDVSLEMEGKVAYDAHFFANTQWEFVEKEHETWLGQLVGNVVPDPVPLLSPIRVNLSRYPRDIASTNAPYFNTSHALSYVSPEDAVPVISVGRQGTLTDQDRPADDAFIAMIDASQRKIRMSLMDIGPRTLPGIKVPLPTVGWPDAYLIPLARAIWERNVKVEIVLSNVNARRGYSNGWTCVDVGSEIIKRIKKQYPKASPRQLRRKAKINLRICYIRHAGKESNYKSGKGIGNHSKYFTVDDICTYIGSQNIYECDLAEFGVVIDDRLTTKKIIEDYWKPLWKASYCKGDCEAKRVIDGLSVDREGEALEYSTEEAFRTSLIAFSRAQLPGNTELYDEDKEEYTPSEV